MRQSQGQKPEIEYLIELSQDIGEAKAGHGLPTLQNITMSVPREEFYFAAQHYKGNKAVGMLKEVENKGRFPRLCIVLLGITLPKYMEDMFKGGRFSDRDILAKNNLHHIRSSDGINSKKN